MTNYIIVDDEPQARKLLQAYMSGIPAFHLVKSCSNAIEAYEALQMGKVDLMFLDIKMPVISGTDFLRSLKNPPFVIFTTAFNKYAMEGYELNIIDYLLKPIAMPRLLNALEKVKERIHSNAERTYPDDYFFIKSENKLIKINVEDVLLIEGMQNYVKIHLKDKVLVASYTMKALENMLVAHQFIRVHRSFILPLKAILSVEGNTIETTYQRVQIGVSYKHNVMRLIHQK